MRQSPMQTTDSILKAKKQKGGSYRELLANLYQHLLKKCLTPGAADMNRPNKCLTNSRLLQSAISNQHFTPWSPQISTLNQQFRISVLPSPISKSADQHFTPAP